MTVMILVSHDCFEVLLTIPTSRAVNLDLAAVRAEILSGILGCDTALDGEATSRYAVLSQA